MGKGRRERPEDVCATSNKPARSALLEGASYGRQRLASTRNFIICFCLHLYRICFHHGHHLWVPRGLNYCKNPEEVDSPFP
ncbi:hypothetical protein DV515_00007266 [Chloebia gouldiae]|uniref:Uncharacterized protein n=1 Tax=Chloebia gouldiae TaxID=44316 RepID=A0A3L8SIM8_CHLGU|nr:hypothetical protein DV515_00007266 [Chloebia gouldiae]